MVDPAGNCIIELSAQGKIAALVDAILAKRNLGTSRNMAPLTIGLGPGFFAGEDVDYVVETMRGHDLARIITEGPAIPNTGVPGMVGGVSKERVIHSPGAGRIHNMAHIADIVEKGDSCLCGRNPCRSLYNRRIKGNYKGRLQCSCWNENRRYRPQKRGEEELLYHFG